MRIKALQADRRARSAARAGDEVDDSGLGPESRGRIIANFGAQAVVEDDAGGLIRCSVRQNLDGLACGDHIVWQRSGGDSGVVTARLPRRSVLTRPDFSGKPKPVAANLDQIAVVVAPRPEPHGALIDRYLVAIAQIGVKALLVVNKADLLKAGDAASDLASLYRGLGYAVIPTSSRSREGLIALREALTDHTSIFVGQSGVGKSSLVNALLPERDIRTQALSEATGFGTHTTTTSTLYPLPDGGDLIDSPGVRGFTPIVADKQAVARGFIELQPFLGRCRFSDCSHRHEPDCTLRQAVADGYIDPRRLESFITLSTTLTE